MSFEIKEQTTPYSFYETSDGYVITKGSSTYRAGTDLAKVEAIVQALNSNTRANVEETADGLYVCWGHHEKDEPCSYELVIA